MIKLSDCELEVRPICSESARSRLCYMAPELIEEKSDVWSLGVSLIEMVEGRNPYGSCSDEEELKRVICYGKPPSLLRKWYTAFDIFVKKCLTKDARKRGSVSELMGVSNCNGE